jgi:serine/threonine-protein kinase
VSPDRKSTVPFVLGKPIKDPADFYGRDADLGEIFDRVRAGQLVSVVGEHRCGNTSIIYQMLLEEVRRRYLPPDDDQKRIFALVSAQLAAGGTEALFRRLALGLRRADPDANVSFDDPIDRVWLEHYLEDVRDRGKRLVLLIDELELLAEMDPTFWEWFEVLVSEYDVAIVATTRTDLAQYRAERGGPPFFNLFQSVYVGSFPPEVVDEFLRDKSELTEVDFKAVKDEIAALAGRFPYYLQLACALLYVNAAGEPHISEEARRETRREFAMRTVTLFEDAWKKLPAVEREALVWLAEDGHDAPNEHGRYRDAFASLEQRGYVIDGRIFSEVFADFVRERVAQLPD